jgi:hypothetical protein
MHSFGLGAAVCSGLILALTPACRAAELTPPLDSRAVAALVTRAQEAPLRDRVQIYADLADKIAQIAAKEIADGDETEAQTTLQQFEACAAQLQTELARDSKGLKKTEMLLHTTNRRLSDMVRSASGDMKPTVLQALKHLNNVQTALLGAVFQH